MLLLLVVVEEALDRGSVVCVLTGEDDFNSEVDQVLPNVSAAVIRRVVEQPVRVVPPVGPLLAEQLGQAREKHQHDVAVRVELRQAQVQLAVGVERSNHVHTVAQRLVADRVLFASQPPLLVAKVEVGQPRLVNVDDAYTLLQQLKHLLGVAHPHDQAPLGVALERHLLEDAVPHVEVVLQDPLHARDRDVETLAVEQMGFDLLGSPDVLPPLDVLCDVLLQLVMPQLPSVPVCGERREGMLRQSYRLD